MTNQESLGSILASAIRNNDERIAKVKIRISIIKNYNSALKIADKNFDDAQIRNAKTILLVLKTLGEAEALKWGDSLLRAATRHWAQAIANARVDGDYEASKYAVTRSL